MAETKGTAVVGGVDTHGKTHHAAVIDQVGRVVGSAEFAATPKGYRSLLTWMRRHGELDRVGVEGTGSYGAGLCHFLVSKDVMVIEVDRPDRRMRRQRGKSDSIDAEAAARSVLAGTATAVPKDRSGLVESIRTLRTVRNGALKAETAAMNSLRSMIVSAPAELRTFLQPLSKTHLLRTCARFRPCEDRLEDPTHATKLALRSLARRIEELREESGRVDVALASLVDQAAPRTLALFGVGVEAAGQLVVTAGSNTDRLRSEASFARLCGVAPIPASSGATNRHRLHRGGDRSANRSLYMVALVRMRHCERTRAYVVKRTGDGLSKKDILRCLKRYIAREVYRALVLDMEALSAT